MTKLYQKKVKLAVQNRNTRWAPFWAILRKYGIGKKTIHPSRLTPRKRHWRRSKLKIKPRRTPKNHLG